MLWVFCSWKNSFFAPKQLNLTRLEQVHIMVRLCMNWFTFLSPLSLIPLVGVDRYCPILNSVVRYFIFPILSASHDWLHSVYLSLISWWKQNQLVLNLEYGLFSATENHFCCTASYLELEPLSCRYNGLAVLRPLWSLLHVLCCCAADQTNCEYHEDVKQLGLLFCCKIELTFMTSVSTFIWGGSICVRDSIFPDYVLWLCFG